MKTLNLTEMYAMKSLRFAAVAAVALALGCTTTPEVKPDPVVVAPVEPPKEKGPDELFAEAVKTFDGGDLTEASRAFARVVEKAPENVSAHYNLGVVAERQGNLALAQENYERAYALDAEHTPTLLNLGKVYRLQGQLDKAVALYEKALALPGREYDVKLLNNLAVSYRLAKQYGKAEATLRKLLSRTKENPEAFKNLALVYYDQGNYRLSEFISNEARKLDDKDPGVYNNLGMIYLKQNQKAEALAQFQKAVELDPKFAPGYQNIGALALSYRDYEAAETALRKALELDPNNPDALLYLAHTLDGQRTRDGKKGIDAGKTFEQYLGWRKDAPEAICGAGWAYTADKEGWQKAITYLKQCRDLPISTEQDKQVIDNRVTGLERMIASAAAQQQPAPEQKREAPKANPGGQSLLDKVSEDAAAQEAAEGAAPEGGEAAPVEGDAPAPAPAG